MKKSLPFLAGLAMTTAVSSMALAQVQQLPDLLVDGGEIGTAAKIANQRRATAPNAIVVIEGEQLNQFNDMSVGDAIRRLPGVVFDGPNRSREIKLRALGKEYTQVYLDGRPLLDADSSRAMQVDRIPAILIERIEITRSPLATQDSQGVAGSVNIITKRSTGPKGGAVSAGIGYLNNNGLTYETSGWTGAQAGRWNYFIGGGIQRRRVEESADTYNFNAAGAYNGGNDQTQKRSFDEGSVLGNFQFSADERNTITIAPSYFLTKEYRDQADYRITAANVNDRRDFEIRNRDRETIGIYTEWKYALNSLTTTRAFLDAQYGTETTTRDSYRLNPPFTTPSNFRFRTEDHTLYRFAPGTTADFTLNGHLLQSGVGLNFQSRKENNSDSNGPPNLGRVYGVDESIYYAFLSDKFSPFGRGDWLTLGVRLEHSISTLTDNLGQDSSKDVTLLNPSIQYHAPIAQETEFRLGFARTVRRPNFRELSPTNTGGNGGTAATAMIVGNPDLDVEKVWGFDVGINRYLYDKSGLLGFNVFSRHFEDKIERFLTSPGGVWTSTIQNTGNGNMFGVELEARVPLAGLNLPNLTLWGNLTAVRTELLDPSTGQSRRFTDQPDVFTNIGVDYFVPQLKSTFGLNFNTVYAYTQDILINVNGVNQRQVSEFSTFNRLDFSIKTEIRPNWTVSFAALNLLGETDDRRVISYNAGGAVTGTAQSLEATYRAYQVRSTVQW